MCSQSICQETYSQATPGRTVWHNGLPIEALEELIIKFYAGINPVVKV